MLNKLRSTTIRNSAALALAAMVISPTAALADPTGPFAYGYSSCANGRWQTIMGTGYFASYEDCFDYYVAQYCAGMVPGHEYEAQCQ